MKIFWAHASTNVDESKVLLIDAPSTLPFKNKIYSNIPFKKDNLGGGFKHFSFSLLPGEASHFDSYFLDGLVQPPTRQFSTKNPNTWIAYLEFTDRRFFSSTCNTVFAANNQRHGRPRPGSPPFFG